MNLSGIFVPLVLTFIAGLSTVIGSFIVIFIRNFNKSVLSYLLGLSAGVMIYLGFMELLPEAIKNIGFIPSNIFFFLGITIMAVIDFFMPHHYIEERIKGGIFDKKIFTAGIMVMIGITIHNFPEGIAVFMSSYTNIKLGVLLALAIALHNIPEGIAVSAPIYYATKNRLKTIKYSFFSGIAEPVGGLIAFFFLQPFLNTNTLSYIFCFVAGVMVFISFDELLPACFKNGQGHIAIAGIISGMLIVAFSQMMFLL